MKCLKLAARRRAPARPARTQRAWSTRRWTEVLRESLVYMKCGEMIYESTQDSCPFLNAALLRERNWMWREGKWTDLDVLVTGDMPKNKRTSSSCFLPTRWYWNAYVFCQVCLPFRPVIKPSKLYFTVFFFLNIAIGFNLLCGKKNTVFVLLWLFCWLMWPALCPESPQATELHQLHHYSLIRRRRGWDWGVGVSSTFCSSMKYSDQIYFAEIVCSCQFGLFLLL